MPYTNQRKNVPGIELGLYTTSTLRFKMLLDSNERMWHDESGHLLLLTPGPVAIVACAILVETNIFSKVVSIFVFGFCYSSIPGTSILLDSRCSYKNKNHLSQYCI